MLRDERTLLSLRSGAVMPDQSSRMSALAGRAATQTRRQAGGSMRFPDNASRIRYLQGVVSIQQRGTRNLPSLTIPNPPTNVIATSGANQVSVAFQAPTNDGGAPIIDYTVFVSPGGSSVSGSSSPIVIIGLQNGTVYTFSVKARNAIGSSVLSTSTSATPATTPSAPTTLSAVNITTTSVDISFNTADNGGSPIINYEYSINAAAPTPTFIALTQIDNSSPITIPGLSASTTYNIKIRAVNALGSGAASATLSVTTASPIIINTVAAPEILYALPDDSAAYIYFTDTTGESNYEYSINGGTYTPLDPVDISSPVKIPGLINGTSYIITLRRVVGSSTSSDSNPIIVTPASAIARTAIMNYDPSNPSSYPGSGTSIINLNSSISSVGTLRGSTSYDSTIRGGVLNFTGGNGTYITFPSYNFGNNITVSAWVYPRIKNDIAGLFTNAGANVITNGFKFQWNSWLTNSRIIGLQAGNGTNGGDYFTPSNTITYNTWQHLTYVFDRANAKFVVFLNGVPATMATTVNTYPNINTNATFNIGGYTGGFYTMNAYLGSIKIYTELFTAADALAEFNATKSRFATPTAPTSLNVDNVIGDGPGFIFTATISFTPPVDIGASSIITYKYSLDNGSTYLDLNTEDNTSPITIEYLTPGTYQLKLRAVNMYGDGAESGPITLTVSTQGPPPG